MSKKMIYLVLALMVICNLLLLFKISNMDTHNTLEMAGSDSTRLSLNKYYHSNTVINAQLNNNIQLKKDLRLTDPDNKTIFLKALVASGPILVVRSSETGCGACIENEMRKIEKLGRIIGDSNIVVITTHSSIRKLSVFKQTNNIMLKMYICPELGLPFEKTNENPFMFLLDADLTAQHFFIPEITEPEISQAYYSAIYKRYFKKDAHAQFTDFPDL